MKKNSLFGICALLLMIAGLSSCSSDDDDIFDDKQEKFDSKLLLGYWIALDDGEGANWGWWFSNEPSSKSSNDKTARIWRQDNTTGKRTWGETTFWNVSNDGKIHIWLWEGDRVVTHLTKNRMRIMSWWLDSEPAYAEYKRMNSAPKIEERE